MRSNFWHKNQRWLIFSLMISLASLLLLIQPAAAHHPFGGKTPDNFLEGFLSGLGHPIIGLDHLAFVIASGLLGTRLSQGFLIPIAFVVATLLGTGIHLEGINLPFPDGIIASSLIVFGVLLALRNSPLITSYLSVITVSTLATLAGVFHGYAYGEAIIGSEMSPLIAYLAGFSLIQLAIAGGAFGLGKVIFKTWQEKSFIILKVIGLVIAGIGVAFLSSAMLGY